MEILTKDELILRYSEIIRKIKDGAVFIHPTDTIYGIGCNALNENSVRKIRELKRRADNPFSVWAPSLKWIKDNCAVDKKDQEWLNKLPGPYTLVLKLKNRKAVAKNVSGADTLGVRMPDHWFAKVVQDIEVPIVTTSVNKAGDTFMTDRNNLDPEIQKGVSFFFYEGEKKGRPSKIINLVKKEVIQR
ncbi:MAG TPA: L-threonylcarbamoyladenylate synthase [Candidatus Nanoarchaeia archaeon]|nr:L-threonylcarbamoyladenylate synthase [Candidatus Nanoarchaeia archaeon]